MWRWVAGAAVVAALGCSDSEADGTPGSSAATGGGGSAQGGGGASGGAGGATGGSGGDPATGGGGEGGVGGAPPFVLTSPAFSEGTMIPDVHTCLGADISPALEWTAGPGGTLSYAVVMRDIDFTASDPDGYLHWVIWDIPASAMGLPEDVDNDFEPADVPGAMQATSFNGMRGFAGSCSGASINTYRFTVHAMPVTTLGLDMTTTREDAADAIESGSTASASLSGEH